MIARLNDLAQSTAQGFGCTAETEWEIGPGPVINDEALCAFAAQTAARLGFAVGVQDNTMGGEDFSEYLKRCPGLFIRVGTGGGYSNHHPMFTADPAALWPAAQFFAELARRRACADTQ
jgi:metal-dependent amidase/aminoacylase/carboxypeptidase family protein